MARKAHLMKNIESVVGSKVTEEEKSKATEAYAIVGELILMASMLDYQVNKVMIELLHLEYSTMLEPTIATLDISRKIEIIKSRCRIMPKGVWRENTEKYVKLVEAVQGDRNKVAHGIMKIENGRPILVFMAAAKFLKLLDFKSGTLKSMEFSEFTPAIRKGEEALHLGGVLISNLEKLSQAVRDRNSQGHDGKVD